MHPRWRRQLAELGARPGAAGQSVLRRWARREEMDAVVLLAVVLEALAHLHGLPASRC